MREPNQSRRRTAAKPAAQPAQAPIDISELEPGAWLTRRQLADVLSTNEDAISAAIVEGRDWVPPAYRFGNRRIQYFRRSDVAAMFRPWKEGA